MKNATAGKQINLMAVSGTKVSPEKTGTSMTLGIEDVVELKSKGILFTPTFKTDDPETTSVTSVPNFERKGYQRPPDLARVRRIAAHYTNKDVLGFTTPIIISVRKKLGPEQLEKLLNAVLEGDSAAAKDLQYALAVIDGQHRLDGVCLAYNNALEADAEPFEFNVVFLALHGLKYPEETEVFNIINTTTKRLPKALVEWNKFSVTDQGLETRDQEIRYIAVQLSTAEDSVWSDFVNLTGTGRELGRPVTLEGLRRSTLNMLNMGGVRHLRLERQLALAKHYWLIVSEVFEDAWVGRQEQRMMEDGQYAETGSVHTTEDGKEIKVPAITYRIMDLVGVASLAKLGGDILAEALGSADPEAYMRAELEKIEEVDWRKGDPANLWTSGQAGFAGQKGLYDALSYLRARGEAPWEAVVVEGDDADV